MMTESSKLVRFFFWSLIIAAILMCVITFAPIPKHWSFESKSELEQIRTELPLAEARWKAHGITNYEIDANTFIHPSSCINFVNNTLSPWHLKVRDGEVIYENEAQKQLDDECNISNFLPPKVFSTVRDILEHAQPENRYIEIEFDSEYGFLSDYSVTSNNRISDLNVTYTFSNFHPEKP